MKIRGYLAIWAAAALLLTGCAAGGGTAEESALAPAEEDRLVEFLALEGGDIVATGAVCFYPFPPSFTNPTGQFGYLTNMYTSPGFRGRGLATRMLDLAVAECRRRGVVRLFLAASQMGRPVYERYGFQAAGNWYSLSLG